MMPGDVYRVGMPRTDLNVVMGDLVLLDEEIPAVTSGLLASGLEITAIHNHLNEMSPHVMYVHYTGHGDAVQLAKELRQALGASATPLGGPPPAPARPAGRRSTPSRSSKRSAARAVTRAVPCSR
jgi:hypothetical protein